MTTPSHLRAKRRPTQVRSRKSVQRILDATCRLLERGSFADITTNHIAKESGLTVGSIYQFFPNKHAIIYELAQQWFQHVEKESSAFVDKALNNSPDAVETVKALFVFMSTEYESPVQNADFELSTALRSHPDLIFLDHKNMDQQSRLLRRIFVHFTSPTDEQALLKYCRFMHEIMLSCSYRVAKADDKEKDIYLAWALDVIAGLADRGMNEST